MLKLCLGYLKSTQLFNTYANTIQNLFIVLTQLCIYYAIESYAFPSNLNPMYSLNIKVKQLLHSISMLTFISNNILSFYIVLCIILCYVNETYLQPMFLLSDILIQFYHHIKATQLLHKRIFSYVTHMKNICSLCISYVIFQHSIQNTRHADGTG